MANDRVCVFFFFNDTATTEIYTLSLHDALPICLFDQGPVGGTAPHGGPESDLAFFLTSEHTATQRDQHVTVAVAEESVDQVCRGGTGGSVVDADVGDALAQRNVGDQGDDGNPVLVEFRDGVGNLGDVGGLEYDAHGTAVADVVQDLHDVRGAALLPEIEPGSNHGRPQRRQLGLQRGLDRRGEPVRGLHDHVDQECAAVQSKLAALPVQVGDGLPHVAHGAGAHPWSVVENPVDGGFTEPRLTGDLPDRIRMSHASNSDGLMRSWSRSECATLCALKYSAKRCR